MSAGFDCVCAGVEGLLAESVGHFFLTFKLNGKCSSFEIS